MFSILAKKYNAPNPLDGNVTKSTPSTFGATSMFGSTPNTVGFGSNNKSPFEQSSTSSASTPFGQPPAPPTSTPFGQPSAPSTSTPFGQSTAPSPSTPFGQTAALPPSTPFGQTQSPVPSTPFGNTTSGPSTPFGQAGTPIASTPFGTSGGETKFGGKTARELLVSFYQERNPSQLAKVDQLLTKYAGKEEQLLRNLAKKYNIDPSLFGLKTAHTPQASGIGSSTPAFGQTSGFGSPSPFGQSSGFSASSSATFGQNVASTPSSGFGSFSQNRGGFGSLSGNNSGFGSTGFASPPAATPFGAARR